MGVLDAEYQRMYDLKIRFRAVSQTNQRAYRHHSELRTAQKGGQSQDSHSSLSRRRKQRRKRQKTAILAHISKKPSQIPTNIVKQPENANMDVLEHRKSKITGAIMANGLADRFKRGDESVMEMMKRIKGEITTDATADQWENKLEEFGVVF